VGSAVFAEMLWQFAYDPFGSNARYFQIKNLATGKLIEEREIGFPNVHPEIFEGDNLGQLWEFVSHRTQIYDRFNVKNHVVATMSADLQKEKRIPSFALVNRRTGRTLNLKSSTAANGVVTVEGNLQDLENQWYLYASKSDAGAYAIGSKESGMVLDHFYERALEATATNGDHRHHQWKLIPSGPDPEFFQIQNVASGKVIEERTVGAPNVYPSQPGNWAQEWRIIPSRIKSWDFIVADDAILSVLGPSLPIDPATRLRDFIEERRPHVEKVWPGITPHLPKDPTFLCDVAPAIKAIFFHLIGQWVDDSVSTSFTAGNKLTVDRENVNNLLGISLPRVSSEGWLEDDCFTISLQNPYDGGSSGQPLANILGKYNKKAVLHVVVPFDVKFYREQFRQAMWHSFVAGTCVFMNEARLLPQPSDSFPSSQNLPPSLADGLAIGHGWVPFTLAMLGAATNFWPLGM
jgi:hypothetical protein